MRKIQTLLAIEIEQLRSAIQTTQNATYKKRCQCILYSYHGLSIAELTEIVGVSRGCITNWLNRWEKDRMAGLLDKPGRGTKPKLNPRNAYHVEQVMRAIRLYPGKPQRALHQINQALSMSINKATLYRFIKKIAKTTPLVLSSIGFSIFGLMPSH